MIMDRHELEQAILGAQLRETRESKLPRIIAYMIGRYIDYIKKGVSIVNFHPLPFDVIKGKTRVSKEDKQRMERIFAERDRKRKLKK